MLDFKKKIFFCHLWIFRFHRYLVKCELELSIWCISNINLYIFYKLPLVAGSCFSRHHMSDRAFWFKINMTDKVFYCCSSFSWDEELNACKISAKRLTGRKSEMNSREVIWWFINEIFVPCLNRTNFYR